MDILFMVEVTPDEFERCFIGICPSCKGNSLRAVKLSGRRYFVECCQGCTFEQISSRSPIILTPTSFDVFKARQAEQKLKNKG